jgi:hypothetical protein
MDITSEPFPLDTLAAKIGEMNGGERHVGSWDTSEGRQLRSDREQADHG